LVAANGGNEFAEATFAGTHGNEQQAPETDLTRHGGSLPQSTRSRSSDFDGSDTPCPSRLGQKAGPGRSADIRGGEDRRTQIPEERACICHRRPAVPDQIGLCEGGGYSIAALSVWLLAWRLLFIWVSAR
jgi:hypothetical protein